jgi:hypothetical protein
MAAEVPNNATSSGAAADAMENSVVATFIVELLRVALV